MNTAPKPNFSISAQYLGPVFSLNGELTKNAQNLVFARNGTGKSFLSRAFRYLDLHGQGLAPDNASRNLVSDESPNGNGGFSFGRGTETMGSLQLEKAGDESTAQLNDTIFHVFSEDFVQEELREQQFNLDGDIKNQIAVDSTNIQLNEAEEVLAIAESAAQQALDTLKSDFDKERTSQLVVKAGVRKQLREYGALSVEALLASYPEKPEPPQKSFAEILKGLDSLKSIPAEPVYPEVVKSIGLDDIDIKALADILNKVTSPSSVSETIKKKIDANRDFYKTGVDIIDQEHLSSCPFCEQGIMASNPKSIIDAYVEYFSDEEAKHKSELRDFYAALNNKERQLTETENELARQNSRYDKLRAYLPSMKDKPLAQYESAIKAAARVIASMKSTIEDKAKSLGLSASLPDDDLAARIGEIGQIIQENNESVDALRQAVSKADGERKKLHRKACIVFEREFTISRWSDIDALQALQKDAKDKHAALAALRKSSLSADARDRVADTFEILLKDFFGEKYVFHKDAFVLTRGAHEMTRGPHRTLSDGE